MGRTTVWPRVDAVTVGHKDKFAGLEPSPTDNSNLQPAVSHACRVISTYVCTCCNSPTRAGLAMTCLSCLLGLLSSPPLVALRNDLLPDDSSACCRCPWTTQRRILFPMRNHNRHMQSVCKSHRARPPCRESLPASCSCHCFIPGAHDIQECSGDERPGWPC